MRSTGVASVAALAVVAAASAYIVVSTVQTGGRTAQRGGGTVTGPAGDAFELSYPAGWKLVPPPVIGKDESALVAIRKLQGAAELIVHRAGPLGTLGQPLVDSMNRSLGARFGDYRFEAADLIHLRQGKALFFSYVRKRTNRLLTITLVPAGRRSYVIDTVSAAKDGAAARDIGLILRSFRRP